MNRLILLAIVAALALVSFPSSGWAAEPTSEVPPALQSDSEDPIDPPSPRRLGKLGDTGLGISLLGGVIAGAGLTMVAYGDRDYRTKIREDGVVLKRTLRPPGIAVTVIGAAVIAGGIAVAVFDGVRRKRSRRRTALAPAFGPPLVGATLRGRF